MASQQLHAVFDAMRTRLQAELDNQLAAIQSQHESDLDEARQAHDARAAHETQRQLDAVRAEWAAQLDAERSALTSAYEQNLRDAADRFESQRAADAEAQRLARDEWEAERSRLTAELQALRESHDAAQRDEADKLSHLVRERDDLTSALAAERALRMDERILLDAAVAAAKADGDRYAEERDAISGRVGELEARCAAAEAALSDARSRAAGSIDAAGRAHEIALSEARTAERQLQLSTIERILASVRTISDAKSLSDVLGALVTAAAAESPRTALLIVNGQQLQLWKALGFADDEAPSSQLTLARGGILGEAVQTASVVSSSAGGAPEFARLPDDRAAIAVPVTVGGQAVAVLYADDGGESATAAPGAWPELVQIIGRHAAVCLAHLTAVRTAQAMRPRAAADAGAGSAGDEANSARRYARLLVSEIKLYNEAAVRLGRERRDLLTRLRPEIDRARRLYEERVPASIGSRSAFFHQELVHTLADGDAGLLGSPA